MSIFRKVGRGAFVGVLIVNISNMANAVELVEEEVLRCLQTIVEKTSFLSVQYQLEKRISGVDGCLKAFGELQLEKGKGLVWHIEKPIDETYVFSSKKFFLFHNGKLISEKQNDLSKIFSDLWLSFIKSPIESLREQFFVTAKKEERKWFLRLEPKDNTLLEIFQEITLTGTNEIKEVSFYSSNGNRTIVSFEKLSKKSPELLYRLLK